MRSLPGTPPPGTVSGSAGTSVGPSTTIRRPHQLEADSREEAEQLIGADPFVREELLASSSSIERWLVDP